MFITGVEALLGFFRLTKSAAGITIKKNSIGKIIIMKIASPVAVAVKKWILAMLINVSICYA